MSRGIISSRYARALLKFVGLNGDGKLSCAQAEKLETALLKLPDIKRIVNDPQAYRISQKMDLLRSVVAPERLSGSLDRFLELVIRNGRVNDLRFILHTFRLMYLKSMNIHLASVTTATEAPDWLEERLRGFVKDNLGGELLLEKKVDPAIIGGMVFTVDDYLFDASVRKQLEDIRKEFIDKNKRIV